jgi:Lipocalin-like domain
MNRSYLIIAFLLLMLSCNNNSENNKLIIGNWSGAEWLVNGNPSDMNAKDTHFTFNDKGEYTFEYAGNKEKGTYKIENDMLFTTPVDEHEIMVKIIRLTKDSLIFDMNRGGQPETLTLLKK